MLYTNKVRKSETNSKVRTLTSVSGVFCTQVTDLDVGAGAAGRLRAGSKAIAHVL